MPKERPIVNREELKKFLSNHLGVYSAEYARAVQKCNKGNAFAPLILLGNSVDGLRDKNQRQEAHTKIFFNETIISKLTPLQAFVYREMGGVRWLRPLLNLILADMADWSKLVKANKQHTPEGLALAQKVPAALLSDDMANKVEKAVGGWRAVQNVYTSRSSIPLAWEDMEELRITEYTSHPATLGTKVIRDRFNGGQVGVKTSKKGTLKIKVLRGKGKMTGGGGTQKRGTQFSNIGFKASNT